MSNEKRKMSVTDRETCTYITTGLSKTVARSGLKDGDSMTLSVQLKADVDSWSDTCQAEILGEMMTCPSEVNSQKKWKTRMCPLLPH